MHTLGRIIAFPTGCTMHAIANNLKVCRNARTDLEVILGKVPRLDLVL